MVSKKECIMARFIALALSGLLACATFSQAQSSSRGSVPPIRGRLENSRYLPDAPRNADSVPQERSLRTEPLAPIAPRPTINDPAYFRDDFKPAAFINRVYGDVLGREPSDRESSYWLLRMQNESRRDIAYELMQRRPLYWIGHYDPRYGSLRYPDPASRSFPDPGGPYFNSPYLPNYQYARPISAFPTRARG